MKRVTTLLVLGLLAALIPGTAHADYEYGQAVVQSVQVDKPTYAGPCHGRENDLKVTVQLTYTGPGRAYVSYTLSGISDEYVHHVHQQEQNGPGTYEFRIPLTESGTRQLKVVGLVWNGGEPIETGTPVQVTIDRTCQDAKATVEPVGDYTGLCGSETTTPIKGVITSPIAQTVRYQWYYAITYGGSPVPGHEIQTLVFDSPGAREVTGFLPRTSSGWPRRYYINIIEPSPNPSQAVINQTTCATPPVDIAGASRLNYDGPCGPDFSTPTRAMITSGKGETRYQWVDENATPLPGTGVQTVNISEHGGTRYVDGPRLPRQRPGSGKVGIVFPDLRTDVIGLASWSTTCRPLATPNLTQVEFTSEEESCELRRPATFTLKGSITALGPGPIRYAYARKSAQTNNAWVRDPWTSLTLTSAGTVDVPKQWTVPFSRQGEQGYWRLEIDEPYTGVSGQARYWFFCSNWP
ncbi:hypothetical protein [Streptosporangium sp. NPDC000509]|uniref:hypothetical protein n=1 Tax=Streptosporangium sp. NPDC000509 TaxID=3366186 RepID=UPI00368882F2